VGAGQAGQGLSHRTRDAALDDAGLADGQPRHAGAWTISLGASAEKLARMYDIPRDDQDEFALRRHRLAGRAHDDGALTEIVPVPDVELTRDEAIRADTSMERLGTLKAAFVPGGTVTAGNSSPLNDGAAMLLMGAAEAGERIGRAPLARVVATGVHGVDPDVFGIAPVQAANRALDRAGLSWDDIAAVELNEAFASQSVVCMDELGLDPEKVNVNGGAIALGHPLGCSGARLMTSLVWELRRQDARYGIATLCVGVGQGVATVVEAL
jgi:acetyl-CoA acetyltransferase family protein